MEQTSKLLLQEDDVFKTDEGLVFNPFNSLNIEIRLNDVQSILKKYGLPPKVDNLNLYKRAFVHRSYTKSPTIENDLENITDFLAFGDELWNKKNPLNELNHLLGLPQ